MLFKQRLVDDDGFSTAKFLIVLGFSQKESSSGSTFKKSSGGLLLLLNILR
jgi:hypothetical protein